jgi:hypothetical protein
MSQFEYQVTMHSSESFKELVYFCSQEGSCTVEEVSGDQKGKLENILNDHGKMGWELAHASFGKEGVLMFWKRIVGQ